MATTKRLICIFDCEDHAGFPNMIKDFLGDAYEYEVFQAPKLLLPPVDETSRYDCFILTGSLTSAHETEKEIPGTWKQNSNEKAKADWHLLWAADYCALFGGKCEKAEQPRHGIEKLKFEPQFYEVKAVRTAAKEVFGMSPPFDELLFPSIEPIEFRSDYLSQIPPSATLLAKSKYSPAEAFTIGDDILGVQFHPEFTKEFVLRDLLPYKKSKDPSFELHAPETSFDVTKSTQMFMQSFLRAFIEDN